jgi:uncharacterized membrane protein YjjB (DUF3815 family)
LTVVFVAVLFVLVPTVLLAQATIAGVVQDASGHSWPQSIAIVTPRVVRISAELER